jgi:hypothetical protein
MKVLDKIPHCTTAFFSILSTRKHIPHRRGPWAGVLSTVNGLPQQNRRMTNRALSASIPRMQLPPPVVPAGRPKVLVAAAIINFIVGALSFFAILGVLMSFFAAKLDPVSGAMMADPFMKNFQIISGLASVISGIVLIIAGVGLLKCRNWARLTTIGYGIYSVLASIVGSYVTFVFILPVTQKAMQDQMASLGAKGAEGAEIAMKAGAIGGMVGAAFGILFALAIAITLIVLVTRPQAKAACNRLA